MAEELPSQREKSMNALHLGSRRCGVLLTLLAGVLFLTLPSPGIGAGSQPTQLTDNLAAAVDGASHWFVQGKRRGELQQGQGQQQGNNQQGNLQGLEQNLCKR